MYSSLCSWKRKKFCECLLLNSAILFHIIISVQQLPLYFEIFSSWHILTWWIHIIYSLLHVYLRLSADQPVFAPRIQSREPGLFEEEKGFMSTKYSQLLSVFGTVMSLVCLLLIIVTVAVCIRHRRAITKSETFFTETDLSSCSSEDVGSYDSIRSKLSTGRRGLYMVEKDSSLSGLQMWTVPQNGIKKRQNKDNVWHQCGVAEHPPRPPMGSAIITWVKCKLSDIDDRWISFRAVIALFYMSTTKKLSLIDTVVWHQRMLMAWYEITRHRISSLIPYPMERHREDTQ